MSQAHLPSGATLEYLTFGSPADPPLLLVNGLGAQLVSWPSGFCERLADGGSFVIAFDNRDCGLSSKFDGAPVDIASVMSAAQSGDYEKAREFAPYTLSDMAGDAVDLLTFLGIDQAHVMGASLGGGVAQTIAIEHPERMLSLISMMSTTSEHEFGRPTPEAAEALFAPPPSDRAGFIDATARTLIWRSKKYPGLESARRVAAESYDRCFCPEGTTRQLAAMIASGPRADSLRQVRIPTLVIHGLDDTLITPSGGERTAKLVPGAKLMLVEDMGHDRPEPLWPVLAGAIVEHCKVAGS